MAESNQRQESIHTWDKIGIPKRFLLKELSDLRGYEKQVEKAATAISNGLSVFITGECGTGKTHMAVGLLKLWAKLNEPQTPLFVPSVEFFAELKSSFDSQTLNERDIIARYTSAPLLSLDDVGVEKVSEWSRQQFFLVIDRRYRNMKPVIVTSNLSLDQVAANIDDRLASRLLEMGEIIKLDGPDRRVSDPALRIAPLNKPMPSEAPPTVDERERVQAMLAELIANREMLVKSAPSAMKVENEVTPTLEKTDDELHQENERRRSLKEQANKLKAIK